MKARIFLNENAEQVSKLLGKDFVGTVVSAYHASINGKENATVILFEAEHDEIVAAAKQVRVALRSSEVDVYVEDEAGKGLVFEFVSIFKDYRAAQIWHEHSKRLGIFGVPAYVYTHKNVIHAEGFIKNTIGPDDARVQQAEVLNKWISGREVCFVPTAVEKI